LSCNLIATWHAVQITSRATEDFIAATDQIPAGSIFIRLRYPTPVATEYYGLAAMGRDPFFHLDAYSASRRDLIDLSDYEAIDPIFPLSLRPRISDAQQVSLWGLEGPDEHTEQTLTWLRDSLPVPIDYVVLVADDSSIAAANPDLAGVVRWLDNNMRPFATSNGIKFVRIYRRIAKAPAPRL
jgi:hypothetical protein